jgi:two-component sensor histidine kinase
MHRVGVNEPRELSPTTVLFNSLASTLEEDVIGVVLSGTGNDGALGMAIHELTTNAVKYGALPVPDGNIKVT